MKSCSNIIFMFTFSYILLLYILYIYMFHIQIYITFYMYYTFSHHLNSLKIISPNLITQLHKSLCQLHCLWSCQFNSAYNISFATPQYATISCLIYLSKLCSLALHLLFFLCFCFLIFPKA